MADARKIYLEELHKMLSNTYDDVEFSICNGEITWECPDKDLNKKITRDIDLFTDGFYGYLRGDYDNG